VHVVSAHANVSGTKQKIEQSYRMKQEALKALETLATDPTILHLLGRFVRRFTSRFTIIRYHHWPLLEWLIQSAAVLLRFDWRFVIW
jgi:hypothetical protein